jgi:hypothetical protein
MSTFLSSVVCVKWDSVVLGIQVHSGLLQSGNSCLEGIQTNTSSQNFCIELVHRRSVVNAVHLCYSAVFRLLRSNEHQAARYDSGIACCFIFSSLQDQDHVLASPPCRSKNPTVSPDSPRILLTFHHGRVKQLHQAIHSIEPTRHKEPRR